MTFSFILQDITKLAEKLPNWMIFIVIILLILTPIITHIISIIKTNKSSSKTTSSIDKMLLYQEGQSKRLDILIDVLYEKYANNLTLETAKHIINMAYINLAYNIIEHVTIKIIDDRNYNNQGFTINKFKEETRVFIVNKYYETIMILNKMRCKGIALNLYLSNKINPNDVINEIFELLAENKDMAKFELNSCQTERIKSTFQTYINKTNSYLETEYKQTIIE